MNRGPRALSHSQNTSVNVYLGRLFDMLQITNCYLREFWWNALTTWDPDQSVHRWSGKARYTIGVAWGNCRNDEEVRFECCDRSSASTCPCLPTSRRLVSRLARWLFTICGSTWKSRGGRKRSWRGRRKNLLMRSTIWFIHSFVANGMSYMYGWHMVPFEKVIQIWVLWECVL